MGSGYWTRSDFEHYSKRAGRSVDKRGAISGRYSAQEMYVNRKLSKVLNPCGVMRECCDSAEHPNTLPVILALDVTGSMGESAVEFAKKLNIIITDLYKKVDDVEFLVMGIGDFMYDLAPLQASQFESDIRIAEQLDQMFFEGGGGGNSFESYTAAWYFGARHTKLDCTKRGAKGIIITIGDEPINPYIPLQGHYTNFNKYMGDHLQEDVDSRSILAEALEKFEIFHLVAEHGLMSEKWSQKNRESFEEYLGADHVKNVTVDSIDRTLVDIITTVADEQKRSVKNKAEITWDAAADSPEGNYAEKTLFPENMDCGSDTDRSDSDAETVSFGSGAETVSWGSGAKTVSFGSGTDADKHPADEEQTGFFSKLFRKVSW